MHGIAISLAERRHVPALLGLLEELFTQEQDFTPNPQKQVLGLLQIIDHPECGKIFIARYNNEVIGMATVLFTISTAEGGPVIQLEDVIVMRPFRDRGVGSQMIQHILSWAQSRGFLRITLLTDKENIGALRFYEQHGFSLSSMFVLRLNLDKHYSGYQEISSI